MKTDTPGDLARIVTHLSSGGVVAYPTEGVWGLGCLPHDERAVRHILTLKGRPVEAGLILVAGEIAQVESYLHQVGEAERQLLVEHWPGPVTFLIPDKRVAPVWIRGAHETVAVRVSAHTTIRSLCAAVAGPIVSTSANPRGAEPAQTEAEARGYFGSDVMYVGGETDGLGKPSRIIDLRTGQEVRG